jgi:hypothetical protein
LHAEFRVKWSKHLVGPKPELENIVYSDSRLKKRFLVFLSRFVSLGFKVCKKCYNDPTNIFFTTFWYGYQKTQNWMLISNPLKKVISIKELKLCAFSSFSTLWKSSQPSNFLCVNFPDTFSIDIKSCVF